MWWRGFHQVRRAFFCPIGFGRFRILDISVRVLWFFTSKRNHPCSIRFLLGSDQHSPHASSTPAIPAPQDAKAACETSVKSARSLVSRSGTLVYSLRRTTSRASHRGWCGSNGVIFLEGKEMHWRLALQFDANVTKIVADYVLLYVDPAVVRAPS